VAGQWDRQREQRPRAGVETHQPSDNPTDLPMIGLPTFKQTLGLLTCFAVAAAFSKGAYADPPARLDFQGQSWIGLHVQNLQKTEHLGRDAMQITTNHSDSFAAINGVAFQTGVIELDLAPIGRSAPGIGLYGASDGSAFDQVLFNLWPRFAADPPGRLHQAILANNEEASVVINFRLLPGETTATWESGRWFHVKMVVKEELCEVYFNHDAVSTLTIHNPFQAARGARLGICGGSCFVSNVQITPSQDLD